MTGPSDVTPPGAERPPGNALVPYLPPQPAPVVRPDRRRSSRVVVALTVLLVALLVAGGLVGWRLWSTTRDWRDAAADWEALARTHGTQLAQAQADLEATAGELEATRAQLATAQARITELADEKARLGDTTAAQQQLADYQARVSQAAGRVATALATCVDGQERLIGYLGDAASYDAADVARFRSEVERVCGLATEANTQLQTELQR